MSDVTPKSARERADALVKEMGEVGLCVVDDQYCPYDECDAVIDAVRSLAEQVERLESQIEWFKRNASVDS